MATWHPRPHIIIVPTSDEPYVLQIDVKKFEDAIVWDLNDMAGDLQHAVAIINLN